MSEVTEVRVYLPVINEIRCTGCGDCVIACPVGAQVDKKALLRIVGGKCQVVVDDVGKRRGSGSEARFPCPLG